jgi:maspardin
MIKRRYLFALGALALMIGGLYLIQTPQRKFAELYEGTEGSLTASLDSLRALPTKSISVDGHTWNYFSGGEGKENILFLHGMAGGYDIWWQQIGALREKYHVITVTYPPVNSLQAMSDAVISILDAEHIQETHVIGSSLGGYFAQYLKTKYPERFRKAVFGNTFPPNEIYRTKNATTAMIGAYLPEWLVMAAFRGNIRKSVVPASEFSPTVEAYLLEQSYGGMSKAQFLARYHCVVDTFEPNPSLSQSHDILIIESNNDPLIFPELRQRLKQYYPGAKVYSFRGVGHFPYLNEPRTYNRVITEFLNGN